jgi:CHAT domain-containing protein
VVGLQRAFKVAGAKNLIMSLWKVPDRKTEILMAKFYTNWLEKKMPIAQSLATAQVDMRKQGFDVYDWGGFILLQ